MAEQAEDIGKAASQSYVYLFEAKGVQRWLFDSGPLRDLIGASDLVAGLASSDKVDLLSEVLKPLGLDNDVEFSRRAGGAFCIHCADLVKLQSFRALWRLAAALQCPGLEFSDAGPLEAENEVLGVKKAYKAGSGVRFNSAADLPPTGHPYTMFSPRTGRLATGVRAYRKDKTLVDVVSQAHRDHAEILATTFITNKTLDRVARRFLSVARQKEEPPFVFPRNLEADDENEYGNPLFPFRDNDRRIAVLHADLSGLGQIFRKAGETAKSASEVREIGEAIETIVIEAARAASETLIASGDASATGECPAKACAGGKLRVLPARPVLLGGDDITILVRADLAFGFAEALLLQIEELSRKTFGEFKKRRRDLGVDYVSACAGLAIVKAGQPFLMANELAEKLVKHAKVSAKKHAAPYPSFLAFHLAQSTMREDYDAIRTRELTAGNVSLTGNPYRVGSDATADEHSWGDLKALAEALAGAPEGRGKLIEAGRHLFADQTEAERIWARWRDVLRAANESQWTVVAEALAPFNSDKANSALKESIGPISDALELIDLGAVRDGSPT